MKIMYERYYFMQRKYDMLQVFSILCFKEKKEKFVDLSARRVHPLLIFTLHCNYTTCNFGNFVKFLIGNVSQN